MDREDTYEQFKNEEIPEYHTQETIDRMADEHNWPACPLVNPPGGDDL